MLPTQLKLRSSDTISLQSTWHSATRACFDHDPADQQKASIYNELVTGYEGRDPMARQHALDVSDGIHGSRSIYRHRGCLLRSRTLMSGERIKARARRVRIRVLLPDKHAIPKRSE
jgi:hypothetical protein